MTTAVATVTQQNTHLAVPDYLKGNENSGLGELGGTDFKIPRILLLQPLSPAVQENPGVAIPSEFWHTGLNIPIGPKLNFVPLLVRKRVILWRPQDDNGGGMLAFSADGKEWQNGGNQKFTVNLKGIKEPVIWETKGGVAQSRLLEWGTSNPADNESAPAATMSYEYLCYFPHAPELSPAVLSCNKTALPRAKQFNTSLLIMANGGKPTYCLNVEMDVRMQSEGRNTWAVPNFRIAGTIPKDVYDVTSKLSEQHQNYVVEVLQADVEAATEKAF